MKWRKGRFPLLRLPLAAAGIAVLTGGLAVGGRASEFLTSPFTSTSNSLQSASNIASAPFQTVSNSLTSASPSLGGGRAGGLDPNVDSDGDGVLNGDELRLGTDPLDVDTDDDGIWDGRELQWLLNPLFADTDNDGIQDGTEIGLTCEMVMQAMSAVKEGIKGTDFNKFQPDLDPTCTTNPRNSDSDGGGVVDGLEDCNSNGRVDNMDDSGYNQTLAVNRTQPMGACFVEMPAAPSGAPQRGAGLFGSSGNLVASPWNASANVSGSLSGSAQQSVNSTVGSLPVSGTPSASASTSPLAASQSTVTSPLNSIASTSASPFNASQGASGSLKTLKTQNISQSLTSPSQLALQSLSLPLQSASQSLTSPSASVSPGTTAQPTQGPVSTARLERNPCDRSDDNDTARACPPEAVGGIVPPGTVTCPEGQLYNPVTGECVVMPAPGAPGTVTCPEGQLFNPVTGECVVMPEAGPPIVCGAGTELRDTDNDGLGDTCVATEAEAPTAPEAPPAPQIACGPGTTQQGNACVPVVCPEGFTLLPGHPLADAQGCVDFWADADHDGIPDVWEVDKGLDPTVNDRNQDLDKDGCSNLTEFIMGTDPQNGSDGLCLDYWRPYPPF
ncbi:MAG: hypothetical protein SVK44_02265 [Nitrospirota bacterium]|nr:hypothetical protein [Nitrospirota bacterium]